MITLFAATAWVWVGPWALERFPSDFDQTLHYSGTVAIPATPGAPLAAPIPLSITRHIWATDSTFDTVTIRETIDSTYGDTTRRQTNGYVLDRRTMRSVDGSGNFAFTTDNKVDRGNAFGPNLAMSLDTEGKYQLWNDDTGTSYNVVGNGTTSQAGDLTLVAMTAGTSTHAVSDAYRRFLELPTSTTLADLARIAEVDLAAIMQLLSTALPATMMTELATVTAAPVPLQYQLTATGRLQVEASTGGIVNVSEVVNRLAVSPDLNALGLRTLLRDYALDPTVRSVLDGIDALGRRPALPAMSMRYAQTPQSVASATEAAGDLHDKITLVEQRSRWALFALVPLFIVGALWPRRRTPPPATTTAIRVTRGAAPPQHRQAA